LRELDDDPEFAMSTEHTEPHDVPGCDVAPHVT
jgi:hypothetical protein